MDLQAKITEVVDKIKADPEFAAKFMEDPVKALEEVTGLDLPDDQINPFIESIKEKVNLGGAGNLLGKLKNLF